MSGPCAKVTVTCTLIDYMGRKIVGTNACDNPQEKCPRLPGEDYTKCETVCQQRGHAEIQALRVAGDRACGARAHLDGHTYYCRECQEALFAAGVESLALAQ
ncbi:MAG: hypothetical protein RL684_702 [Pseudomonadota bacterium]|jgi:hypothetical protein